MVRPFNELAMAVARESTERPESPKEDLTTWLISSFKQLIAEGSLIPGCKLPPERELAEMFGVSRSSLRQALKVLQIMGVISQEVSRGTYLETSASAILGEPMEFLVLLDGLSHYELFETRMILEPEMAARAAERATSEDLAVLEQVLQEMKASVSDQRQFIKADLSFHEAIARAAGNRVSHLMLQSIHRAMWTSIERTSGLAKPSLSLGYHRPIYAAIRARDPEAARRTMTEHFVFGRGTLTLSGDRPSGLTQKIGRIAEIRKSSE